MNSKVLILSALLLSGLLPCIVSGALYPSYKLSVSFDIGKNLIRGISTISLPDSTETLIYPGELKVLSVKLNGQPLNIEPAASSAFKVKGGGIIEILYEGIFPEDAGKGISSKGVITEKGISLTGRWYPYMEGLAYYNLTALAPEGFSVISEADEISLFETPGGRQYSFTFPHPVEGISFVAGRYEEHREVSGGIRIYAYFFQEDAALAKTYMEHAKNYLKLYEGLLGPYPFRRFSIVENILPTGYSMPTFTLLGQDIVRLPFIVETSLGHEILHQWFGNYVYGDYSKGNWLEALTTYLSDHLYEEQKGQGHRYRKNILIDYQSHVTEEKEIALSEFSQRKDFATKAIGYGKGSMVFHMLKGIAGEDAFYGALKKLLEEKKFTEASWDDIREAFEETTGEDLGWFFAQWLKRKDIPSLSVKDPRTIFIKGIPTVSFRIMQNAEPYKLQIPVKIITDRGQTRKTLTVEKENEKAEFPVDGNPIELVIDGNYDIMRAASVEETPPVIAKLLGDEKRLMVFRESEKEKYKALLDVFKEEGFLLKEEGEVKDEDIRASSLVVAGLESPVLKRLFAETPAPPHGFSISVRKNPLDISKVVGIAYGDSKEEIEPVPKKIFRYGKYSYLRFEKGKNVEKKTDETEDGIRIRLYEPVSGIKPSEKISLDKIIQTISDKDIIYIGESHTAYEDHRVQLEVIKALNEKGKKFAIGMEMFQRPFQKALDDYISGAITEKEFLKASQYFKRWQFDFHLYREIMEYAKANGIPVAALNQKSEIIKKASQGGLDALSAEEKKEIPADMDMSDEGYRKRLRAVFEQHEGREGKDFEYFHQSQILWDETMAHSAAEFLKKNPGMDMVVLSGAGHIIYGSGIPKRLYRLTGKDYAILINANIDVPDDDIADYVLFPRPLTPPPSPKLMVMLKESEGRVFIESFRPDSIAEKAGLKEGDIFISIDGLKIEAIDDVKISLFDKKEGEPIKVRVLRKRFLLPDRELDFTITW